MTKDNNEAQVGTIEEAFSELPIQQGHDTHLEPHKARKIGLVLAGALTIFPLFMGGVVEVVNMLFWSIIVVATFLFVLTERLTIDRLFKGSLGSTSAVVAWSLLVIPFLAGAQYLFLGISKIDHPVLGSISRQPALGQFLFGWSDTVVCLCVYLLARVYSESRRDRFEFLRRTILFSGTMIALIALSHWFYDTGKLFWVFSPESVFSTSRARWPFVNSNHLGDFLLPCLCLSLGLVSSAYSHLFEREIARGRRRNRSIATLLGSEDFHKRISEPLLATIPLLTILVAILGSQSRGAWLGCAVAGIVFIRGFKKPDFQVSDSNVIVPINKKSSRRGRRSKGALQMDGSWAMQVIQESPRYIKYAGVLTILGAIFFLLNEKGRELIAGRIEYGLLFSLDDIRWTFYKDSLPMFLANPIWGMGLGTWFDNFPKYSSTVVAGLNAIYLHSDPLQYLIECGVLGSLPWITVVGFVSFKFFKASRLITSPRHGVELISLYAAAIGLIVASLPEFPFRIPAIQVMGSVILALLVTRVDHILHSRHRTL